MSNWSWVTVRDARGFRCAGLLNATWNDREGLRAALATAGVDVDGLVGEEVEVKAIPWPEEALLSAAHREQLFDEAGLERLSLDLFGWASGRPDLVERAVSMREEVLTLGRPDDEGRVASTLRTMKSWRHHATAADYAAAMAHDLDVLKSLIIEVRADERLRVATSEAKSTALAGEALWRELIALAPPAVKRWLLEVARPVLGPVTEPGEPA